MLPYLLSILLGAILCRLSLATESRFTDQPFVSELTLLGRNVTCGTQVPGKFPSLTWSCNDIKVDGYRLIFTYFPGPGASRKECGEDIGRNDIAQLCRHLLNAHGIKHNLWTAYVSKSSCGRSEKERMYFMRMNVPGDPQYHWTMEERGKGYIVSLQCMVLD